MPEISLVKHEDSVKLALGMNGKLSIEVKVYDNDEKAAMNKSFYILREAINRAKAEGYMVVTSA